MRIAYICADRGVPVFGQKGCSIHAQEVLRTFLRRGIEVELFAASTNGTPLPGLRLQNPFPAVAGDRATQELAGLAANEHLRAALEKAGPFDFVYERYSLWSYAGMEYARRAGAPGLLEVNAPLVEEQAQYRELIHRAEAEQVAARVFDAAGAIVAVSQGVADYLRQPKKVCVIPNGVRPDRFPMGMPATRPAAPGIFTVGFLGNLKPWHGLPVLIEAFAKLTDARLLIVGDGKERDRLVADIAGRGLTGSVELAGAVVPEAVPGLLASMDVGVAPYGALPGFYFSPLKVYEYMAAGLPVVTSDIGQLSELIADGVNGLLCPPGDVRALAGALGKLQQAPALRAQLGQAGRATVLRDHTWDAVVGKILEIAGVERVQNLRT
jgi:glycosyltransferase involved in cell wall biosynthesis